MRSRFLLCYSLFALAWPVGVQAQTSGGLNIVSHYSALTRKRGKRQSTRYIVLHTTEGSAVGSLAKLRRYGEAHYMIDTAGKIYRIIERDKIAMHAGRSMWNGLTNLDTHSIGIEVVGYHDKNPSAAQIRAVKELLRQLQSIYRIPDQHVLPHSMVAYGRPNRWHPYSHRGRKRCGMCMAKTSLRAQLGLTAKPSYDPDVRAGRLKNADPTLSKVLYGNEPSPKRVSSTPSTQGLNRIGPGQTAWDIAREQYNRASTVYVFPGGETKRGDEILRWHTIPKGTVVRLNSVKGEPESRQELVQVIGRDGANARVIAGDQVNSQSTIFFLANGQVRNGSELTAEQIQALPNGTRMLVGYVYGGRISAKRQAYDICGARWNLATTFYRFADHAIRPGDEIDAKKLQLGVMVFYQR